MIEFEAIEPKYLANWQENPHAEVGLFIDITR